MKRFCVECKVLREVGSKMGGYYALRVCGHMRTEADPEVEITDGELEGWEIMLKVVTNGNGYAGIVLQSNVVAMEPTSDSAELVKWFTEYMMED